MSGHSKWATIKRKKAATDQARGKVFSKFIKEITIAARHGGGDLGANPRLRTAIAAAKAVNMPAGNIDRAVKRGTGEIEGAAYEETQYEGYGLAGVAILVEVATDNRNRTTGEIRNLFSKNGGNLGDAGSVAYLFKPRGSVTIDKGAIPEERLMELALDAGADDVLTDGDAYEVLTSVAAFEAVKHAFESNSIPIQNAELTKVASLHVPVTEREAQSLLRLIDLFEEHDDVQKVYANFEIPDELLAKLTQ